LRTIYQIRRYVSLHPEFVLVRKSWSIHQYQRQNPPYQNPFTAVWFIKIHHRRLVSTSLPPSTHHCRRHQNRTTKGEEQQNQNFMTDLKDKE
jgi:hypothetical protein